MLRDVIPDAAADEARINVAAVHRRNRRFGEAIELSALARDVGSASWPPFARSS